MGRYGLSGCQKISQYDENLFKPIGNTHTVWAEILYGAEYGGICHLSDLLLRRVRIGLLLPRGGFDILDKVESLCKPYLSWDSKMWEKEKKDYIKIWETFYSPPLKRQEI